MLVPLWRKNDAELNALPSCAGFIADFWHKNATRRPTLHSCAIVMAKRPETRQKRIAEIAELAAQKLKPKQF